jgi:SMI1/KNR4 family protein SUKH-1
MLALAGRIDFGNQLWHRAVTSGLPNLNHAFGLVPLLGACAGAGLDVGPDGTPITKELIDRIDREGRERVNPEVTARRVFAEMPGFRPTRPRGDDQRLLNHAFELALPAERAGQWRDTPTADEQRGLEQFDQWFALPDHPTSWLWSEFESARLISADICVRLGEHKTAVRHLGEWFRSSLNGTMGIDTGTFFQLQSLSRLAASGAIRAVLELTDEQCEDAGKRLVEAADDRLSRGRATAPQPFDWKTFLLKLSARAVADYGEHQRAISEHQRKSGWLGEQPASEHVILEAERRLGRRLPPSYRAFLRESNGFGPVSHSVHRLRPVTGIDWFSNEEPETIAIWRGHVDADEPDDAVYLQYGNYQRGFRARYMKSALQISDRFEGDVILLIPDVVNAEGEWETWYFGPAFAGAWRFSSFQEFMEGEATFAGKD